MTQQGEIPRVLHVIAPAPFGGLERVVQSLAAAQVQAGIDVRVLVLLDQDAGGASHPFVAGLAAAIPRTIVTLPPRAYRRERRNVAAVCEEFRPTVVHTHGARVDVVDAPVARAIGAPIVTTVHGFTGGGLKNRAYEWLQRRSFRRMDAVVAVSRAQAAQLGRRMPAGRVVVIPNAWDGRIPEAPRSEARRALGIPAEGFVAGWVGRFTDEKGADLFLDALAHVPGGSSTVHGALLGAGARQTALRARAERLGLGARVTWCGSVPDAGRWFRAFDTFALTSRTEGVPIVLFEAMAAEVPIVATRVGGVPDVLDEREAWLVPVGDATALAEALESSRRNAADARARARAAQVRLRRDFGSSQWVARYADLYRRVAAARRRA